LVRILAIFKGENGFLALQLKLEGEGSRTGTILYLGCGVVLTVVFSDESTEFLSSLLAERLLDRDLAPREQSEDVEWETHVHPEPPVQRPRARRTSKDSATVALLLIDAGGMVRWQWVRGRTRSRGGSERGW
jgi:hypothetical protein